MRCAKRRETSPPIECATRCTGSPAPNALTSASSRAALLSMSSRQSNGNGRTCQRVSSSSSIGTYVLRWSPAGRTLEARPGRLARGRQLELADPAGEEADEVDPDPVDVALAVDRVELRAHDPRQHDDLPELPAAASRARRRVARARRPPRPVSCSSSVGLAAVEREQHAADAVQVAAVERGLELVRSAGVSAALIGAPPGAGCGHALRDRCAAASASWRGPHLPAPFDLCGCASIIPPTPGLSRPRHRADDRRRVENRVDLADHLLAAREPALVVAAERALEDVEEALVAVGARPRARGRRPRRRAVRGPGSRRAGGRS